MIRHVIFRATMSYAIRPAVPGDEKNLLTLIEELARQARRRQPTFAVRVISPMRPLW